MQRSSCRSTSSTRSLCLSYPAGNAAPQLRQASKPGIRIGETAADTSGHERHKPRTSAFCFLPSSRSATGNHQSDGHRSNALLSLLYTHELFRNGHKYKENYAETNMEGITVISEPQQGYLSSYFHGIPEDKSFRTYRQWQENPKSRSSCLPAWSSVYKVYRSP